MHYFVTTNNIQLHVLEKPGIEPTVLLAHGLTANAYCFGPLMAALPYRVLALDLRGRGQSDAPVSGYTMPNHTADLIGLLDALELDQVVLGGHSFGGLLTVYTAVHYPRRLRQCLLMDAGLLHPR